VRASDADREATVESLKRHSAAAYGNASLAVRKGFEGLAL